MKIKVEMELNVKFNMEAAIDANMKVKVHQVNIEWKWRSK